MNSALLPPFLSVALPIIITLIVSGLANNARLSGMDARITDMRNDFNRQFDAVNRGIDEVIVRLDRIEKKLGAFA